MSYSPGPWTIGGCDPGCECLIHVVDAAIALARGTEAIS